MRTVTAGSRLSVLTRYAPAFERSSVALRRSHKVEVVQAPCQTAASPSRLKAGDRKGLRLRSGWEGTARKRLRKEGRASGPRVAMERDAEKYRSKRRVTGHLQTELHD